MGGVTLWVQLRVTKQLDLDGQAKAYHPGDWVEVGKQTALRLVAAGDAVTAQDRLTGFRTGQFPGPAQLPEGCGITSERATKYPKTLILRLGAKVRGDLQLSGFEFLDRWEVVVPLAANYALADSIGDPAERSQTRGVIHDLRVPYYDCRVVFVRDCEAGHRLLDAWEAEILGKDERLAFLRALYQVKPLILAVPPEWVK
jgi:hypothetical protein